jgi:hypothetical protein
MRTVEVTTLNYLNLPRFRGHLPKVDNTEIGGIHVSPETT